MSNCVPSSFEALVARESDGIVLAPESVDLSFPPAPADRSGVVTIAVQYSSVDFDDALAITPKNGVVREIRSFPEAISRTRRRFHEQRLHWRAIRGRSRV
ncbi:hypothetical protein [Rhodococcus sp. 1168]|uniref:hypothetical protein n=1 Tax=Rhodococcus sp. 1168 TaxID=2018041 RepID=UPI0020CB2191|nr:hypothetical protein [Rhodococcus sp. 1168]